MSNGIIYSLIARDDIVLCEGQPRAPGGTGNFPVVTRDLLSKAVLPDSGRSSYSYDEQYTYHCEAKNGLRFICLSVAQFRLKLAYSFLEEVQRQFNGQYGDRAMSANAYQFNQFSDSLLGLMKKWNDPSVDRVQQVQDQIADVKGVMVANIESILERGDKLDMMVNKAENLAESSLGFKQGARKANCMMKKKNIIVTAAIVGSVAIILIVLFILLMITICTRVDCAPKKDDSKKLLRLLM